MMMVFAMGTGHADGSAADGTIRLANEALSLTISVRDGATMTSLMDTQLRHEYLTAAQPLFTWEICEDVRIGGWHWQHSGNSAAMTVEQAVQQGQDTCMLTLVDADAEIRVKTTLTLSGQELRMQTEVENLAQRERYISVCQPDVSAVSVPGEKAKAMVVQEAGWVADYGAGNCLGMAPQADTRLPLGNNAMQVVAVYDEAETGGVYFCDLTGTLDGADGQIQFYIQDQQIKGLWAGTFAAGQTRSLPLLAMGLTRNTDWHGAMDAYLASAQNIQPLADTPDWLRDAGALFSFPAGGAGGINQMQTKAETLSISSFAQMDEVLDEAEAYGTNVILMVHYYQKAKFTVEELKTITADGPKSHYWNKGDYHIREDLGGSEAFRAGVEKVHAQGGHVLLYVEPFIILQYSEIGREAGAQWAARNVGGERDATYAYNYTMIPAYQEWQQYIVEKCRALMEETGADGIYLDSMGWQWNRVQWVLAEKKLYQPEMYNKGFIQLADAIRQAIREVNPDAVVMSEAMGSALQGHVDAAWTADYTGWAKHHDADMLRESPLRYAYASMPLFTGGVTIEQMREMFAAGWSLAVSSTWQQHRTELGRLARLRTQYADCLIHGRQLAGVACDDSRVAAYAYAGETHTLLVAYNGNASAYQGTIELPEALQHQRWMNVLEDGVSTADEDGMPVNIAAHGLLILEMITE